MLDSCAVECVDSVIDAEPSRSAFNRNAMKKSVILCVDDEKMVLTSLKAELKEIFGNQYIIELSEDPGEAIEILENLLEEGYDVPLIISDYIMPTMKGDELLKCIHVKSPKTRSIMLTGQATTEGVTNALNWARLYRYMSKPWEVDDLSMTVKEAIKSYVQEQLLEHQNEQLKRLNDELEKKVEERTREVHKKNQDLQCQAVELNEQNKNIKDSIKAAFKIQQALLPSSDVIKESFPDHFVLFKPKDIVSGDFFWFKQLKNFIYFAAADCTGHGVPGAFMSMLGISQLNDIVSRFKVNSPSLVLSELRGRIKKLLNQNGQLSQSLEGMDIALCAIDIETKTMQYAGAFNPLYIVRDKNDGAGAEIIVKKADRMPIGLYPTDSKDFTNHEFQLIDGDCLYIFSDGYTSQFGGLDGKKLRTYDFQQLLLKIRHLPMDVQKEHLDNFLVKWQNTNEQVDDVLVIGIRINNSTLNNGIVRDISTIASNN